MGFFQNLRTASNMAQASAAVRQLLEVEIASGALKFDSRTTSEKLVLAVLSDEQVVEAMRKNDQPNPSLLAAAALANGVSHFDRQKKPDVAQALFRCLSAFANSAVFRAANRSAETSTLNNKLAEITFSAFDEPEAPSADALKLRTIIEDAARESDA